MNEVKTSEKVQDADTLMASVDGTAVKIFELVSQLEESWSEEDTPLTQEVSLTLQVRPSAEEIEVRMRVEANRSDARMAADVGVKFRFSNSLEYEEGLSREFAEKLGMPYLLSYIRPVLDQMARTLEVPVLSLPPSLTHGNSLIFPTDQ